MGTPFSLYRCAQFGIMKYSPLICTCLLSILLGHQTFGQVDSKDSTGIDHCQAGNEFIDSFQFDKAIEMLRLCYQSTQKNIDCLKKIANCNYKLGRFKEAKSNYFNILREDSLNLTALNQIAVMYSKESQFDKSIEYYEKLIAIDSVNSFYHKQVAILYHKLGDIEKSVLHFNKAHYINPQDIIVISQLGNIYQKLNLHVVADSLIDKGLMLDSTHIKLLLTKAKVAYKKKSYADVVLSINQILKIQKDTSSYALKLLGVSCFHLNDHEKAIALLEKIVKNKQETEVIHYYLGLAYRTIGEIEKSLHHFEQAINMGVTDNLSSYYTNLAVTYEDQKNYKESIRAYQAAYKSSKNKILLYHLARNYDSYYEDKETALRYYERYLTMNDSGNVEFKDYSNHRISELKRIIHFELDTLE